MTRLARASAIQFAVNVGQTVVGALVTLYVVNVLGLAVFGKFALAMAVANWAMIPTVGVRGAVTKRMSEGSDRAAFFSSGLLAQFFVVVALSITLLVATPAINDYVGADIGYILILAVVGTSTGRFFLSSLRGENRIETSSLLEGSWSIARSLFQLGFVIAGFGVEGLIAAEVLASLLTTTAGVLTTNQSFVRPTSEKLWSLYRFGRYAWITNLKEMSYSWLDTVILGFFVSPALVGGYEVAWRVSMLFMLLPKALSKVTFPAISGRAASARLEEAVTVVRRGLSFAGALAIPGLVGSAVLGTEVLALYGAEGAELAAASLFLVVLSAGRVVESYETVLLQTLTALDYPKRTFKIGVAFSVVNLSLNLLLVPAIGTVGAALATALSITVSVALTAMAMPREFDVQLSRPAVTAQVISAVVMGATLFVVVTVAPSEGPLTTVAYIGFGAGMYGFSLLVISAEARDRANQVFVEFTQ